MKTMWIWSVALAAVALVLVSCAPEPVRTTRVAVDREYVQSVNLNSIDVRSAAQELARDLAASPKVNQAGPAKRIKLDTMDDATGEGIDVENVLDTLQELLVRSSVPNVIFLDRKAGHLSKVIAENELKNEGFVDGQSEQLSGADYFLTGRIHRQVDSDTQGVSHFYRLSFTLRDGRSQVIWQGSYNVQRYMR